jgi:hypothetical protein
MLRDVRRRLDTIGSQRSGLSRTNPRDTRAPDCELVEEIRPLPSLTRGLEVYDILGKFAIEFTICLAPLL